jgi:hypothetical protein
MAPLYLWREGGAYGHAADRRDRIYLRILAIRSHL